MKRRLMIARALVHEPKLLILDEPTAGVDIELRNSMWQFLSTLNKNGTTIILTTHYLEEAEELCQNVAFIYLGQVIEQGTVKSLIEKSTSQKIIIDVEAKLPQSIDLGPYEYSVKNDKTLEFTIPKGTNLNDIFIKLQQENIKTISFRNKRNRLEEFFFTAYPQAG